MSVWIAAASCGAVLDQARYYRCCFSGTMAAGSESGKKRLPRGDRTDRRRRGALWRQYAGGSVRRRRYHRGRGVDPGPAGGRRATRPSRVFGRHSCGGKSAGAAAVAVPFSMLGLFLFFLKVGAVLYGSGYVCGFPSSGPGRPFALADAIPTAGRGSGRPKSSRARYSRPRHSSAICWAA